MKPKVNSRSNGRRGFCQKRIYPSRGTSERVVHESLFFSSKRPKKAKAFFQHNNYCICDMVTRRISEFKELNLEDVICFSTFVFFVNGP